MRRLAFKEVLILLTGLVCAISLGGCASCQIPKIDPSGERLFVVEDDISDPTAPNSRFRDYPGKKRSANTSAVVLFPQATVAPVGSEVVMLAAVRGSGNYLRTNERVEWMLSPAGVGQFVEVDNGSWTDPLVCDFTRARKIDNSFAVNSTSRRLLRLTRGTPELSDDVHVLRGQAWVTVTSPTEGSSDVTAHAPDVYEWKNRKDSARIHWVDAQWSFPSPAITAAGSTRVLTTTVARHTDQSARSGWLVRYEILDGPASGFSPSGSQVIEVPTDSSGAASVEIFQQQPSAGTNRIAINVICPAGLSGSQLREPFDVGKGCTLVTWSSADVAIRISGPASATVGDTLKYRIQVSNPGDLAADDVMVTAAVPGGVAYVGSSPRAEQTGNTIRWPVGQLGVGQTRSVEVEYRAEREGSIEACAETSAAGGFSARECALTSVVAPKLEVEIRGPNQAYVGDDVTYEIVVANHGRVATSDLVIQYRFDHGLEHADVPDDRIEREFGRLAAGESRSIGVVLSVVRPGRFSHDATVSGTGGVSGSAEARLVATMAPTVPDNPPPQPTQPITPDPIPPQHTPAPGPVPTLDPSFLSLKIEAPTTSYVGQQSKLDVFVTNEGDQELTGIVVTCLTDPGLRASQASEGHEKRSSDGAILFTLPSMLPGEIWRWEVVYDCEAEADGPRFLVEVTCREGITKTSTAPLPSSLNLTAYASRNPITLGRDLTWRIAVTNESPVDDQNVVVEIDVPPEMALNRLLTRGPVNYEARGQTIRFDPVDSLAPGASLEYSIRLQTRQAGNVILQAKVTSYNVPESLVEKERTTINP